MAGTFEQVGGAAGQLAGNALPGGPITGMALGYAGSKLGAYLDQSPEERQLKAMQKAQFAKLKRGEYLGPSGAEKNQAMAGVAQQQMAAQQQISADQERQAAMGGARSGAFFQAQQQAAQAQQNALAQARLGVEQQSQAIAEQRTKSLEAMLQKRAAEEQQKRGIRGAQGEMTVQETPQAQQFSEWAAKDLAAGNKGQVYGLFNG